MSKTTGIGWCRSTFNPWKGCLEVSPACDNCYARVLDHRLGGNHWNKDGPRQFFKDKHWNEPRRWDREAALEPDQWLVFCASVADVFESYDILDPHRERLWKLIEETRNLTWLLLTKRPQNIKRMLPKSLHGSPNIWLGTTVESPAYLWRIDAVLETLSPVHFLSMEPLLEETDIRQYLGSDKINWAICGAESGPNARFTPVDWYRQLRDSAVSANIPFYLKQAPKGMDGMSIGPGSRLKINTGAMHVDGKVRQGMIEEPYLDGVQWMQFPADTRQRPKTDLFA